MSALLIEVRTATNLGRHLDERDGEQRINYEFLDSHPNASLGATRVLATQAVADVL